MVHGRRAGQDVRRPQDAVGDAGGHRAEQRPGAQADLRLDRVDQRGQVRVEQGARSSASSSASSATTRPRAGR